MNTSVGAPSVHQKCLYLNRRAPTERRPYRIRTLTREKVLMQFENTNRSDRVKTLWMKQEEMFKQSTRPIITEPGAQRPPPTLVLNGLRESDQSWRRSLRSRFCNECRSSYSTQPFHAVSAVGGIFKLQ